MVSRPASPLAAGSLPLATQFDNDATAPCLLNWRTLNLWWKPQTSEAEAITVAEGQARQLGRLSPRRIPEFNLVRESLFAAWIVTLCPNRALVEPHRAAILEAIKHFDYTRLYYSQFFPRRSRLLPPATISAVIVLGQQISVSLTQSPRK